MAARNVGRVVARRFYSAETNPLVDSVSVSNKYDKGTMMHRIGFVVGLSICGAAWYNAMHGGWDRHGRPEFAAYDNLRIVSKQFPWPWGKEGKSLFHNKYTNPTPDGYVTSDEEAAKNAPH